MSTPSSNLTETQSIATGLITPGSIKQSVGFVGLAAILALSGAAQAEDNPWYVGASVTQADINDLDSNSTSAIAGVNRSLDIDSDDDTGFEVKFGKVIHTSANGNELSVELSYSEVDNDLENLSFNGNNFSDGAGTAFGELESQTVLVRALYKFEAGTVDPYLGIGIGNTDLDVSAVYGGSVNSNAGSQPPFVNDSDDAFAYQLRAGLEWEVSDQLGVFLEYTYTDVDDLEFSRVGGGPGGLATTSQETDFDIDAVALGVNYRF